MNAHSSSVRAAVAAAVAASRPAPQHKTKPCTCKAYSFPHRAKSGRCYAAQPGPYCGECGQPCDAKREDFGHGVTEFWGHVSNHRDVHTVSCCCEAEVFSNASLTNPYHD
jgi:hypothetical protein